MLAWGIVTTNSSGYAKATFPKAFKACKMFMTQSVSSHAIMVNVTNYNTTYGELTAFRHDASVGSNDSIRWLAIGTV